MVDTKTPKQRSVTGAKIFVSYAREDKEFAHQLNFMLRDMGFEPLMDVRAIHPGEPWQERLKNLIEQCDKIVFVMTPSYLASEPCEWEVGLAGELKKEMIPVLPAALPDDIVVPGPLAELQYVYFYSDVDAPDSGFYTGTLKLEEAIRTDLDWLGQLRRYQNRAADWQEDRDQDQLLKGGLLAEALDWQKLTPEESDVPAVVAEFIAASEASELKYIAAQKRRMRITAAAAVAAIGFAAVAVYASFESRKSLANLEIARTDNDLLASASESWAQGSGDLGRFKLREEYDYVCPVNQDCSPESAIIKLDEAISKLFPAAPSDDKRLSDEGKEAYRLITAAIRRDYATALFYNNDPSAEAQMDVVIDEMTAELSLLREEGDPGNVQDELSNDYLRRAVYSCSDGQGSAAEIGQKLSEGITVFNETRPDWFDVVDLVKPTEPDEICEEARAALCEIVDCSDGGFNKGGETRSLEPITEEPGDDDPSTGSPTAPAPPPAPPEPLEPGGEEFQMFTNGTPEAFRVQQIYLHISSKSQMAAAKAFKAKLEEIGGYDVLGIEIVDVKFTPSIRYYYNIQLDDVELSVSRHVAEAAAEVLGQVDQVGKEMLGGWTDPDAQKHISLDGRYKGLPRNRIEIWL